METIKRNRIAMKKILYILNFLPLCILAQIGVGTDAPTALLEIKSDPTGIPALALTPQITPKGSATGQMAVIDNKLYLFEEERGKWLSVEQSILEYGRLGFGSDPSEIEYGGGDLQNGPIMPFDGTIVSISISATLDNNNREIGLFLNGNLVPNDNTNVNQDGVFLLHPTTLSYKNSKYNVDFNSGDMISMSLLDPSVNDVDDLIVSLVIKFRKDNP